MESTRAIVHLQGDFGRGVTVLFDASIVRSILASASMKPLGEVNRYYPCFLERVPNIRIEGHEESCRYRLAVVTNHNLSLYVVNEKAEAVAAMNPLLLA